MPEFWKRSPASCCPSMWYWHTHSSGGLEAENESILFLRKFYITSEGVEHRQLTYLLFLAMGGLCICRERKILQRTLPVWSISKSLTGQIWYMELIILILSFSQVDFKANKMPVKNEWKIVNCYIHRVDELHEILKTKWLPFWESHGAWLTDSLWARCPLPVCREHLEWATLPVPNYKTWLPWCTKSMANLTDPLDLSSTVLVSSMSLPVMCLILALWIYLIWIWWPRFQTEPLNSQPSLCSDQALILRVPQLRQPCLVPQLWISCALSLVPSSPNLGRISREVRVRVNDLGTHIDKRLRLYLVYSFYIHTFPPISWSLWDLSSWSIFSY